MTKKSSTSPGGGQYIGQRSGCVFNQSNERLLYMTSSLAAGTPMRGSASVRNRLRGLYPTLAVGGTGAAAYRTATTPLAATALPYALVD